MAAWYARWQPAKEYVTEFSTNKVATRQLLILHTSSLSLGRHDIPELCPARDIETQRTVISNTVTLAQSLLPSIRLEELSDIGATLTITPTDPGAPGEAQVSATPDFAGAPWQPLPLRQPWLWTVSRPRVAWVRFRDAAGAIEPAQAIGPDVQRVYLPLAVWAR